MNEKESTRVAPIKSFIEKRSVIRVGIRVYSFRASAFGRVGYLK